MSSQSVARRSDLTLRVNPRARRGVRAWRWGVVLAVVVALHWVAAQWVERHRDAAQPLDAEHAPVQVALLKPERVEQTLASEAPRPHTATHARAVRPRSEHVLTATRPDAPQSARAAVDAASAAASAPEAAATPAAASNAGEDVKAAQASPGVKLSVPPSGDLQYDTFYNGVRNQPGTIHWTSDGQTYEMIVSVPLPFVGTFSYSSHGHVDAFGIAPDQYIEKRGHRAEDVTIFNRTAKQIAFTRTPATLALPDGAQDRFSMVMQLASLVRGDPGAYKPGVTREFYVADNDSGEIWPIETVGDETLRIPGGFVDARHFMRLPRHEGDRRRIDVWLAPSLGWLPARILQTEPNGTQVELVWRGKLAPADSSGNTDSATDDSATQPDNAPEKP
ncbi:DUF3108 domain-containing protein [Paraburkholderia sp. BL10I2N1]|uniref:DUF3108 domain-containing protein n=1 Tax=Paraburkholderia sp. BL10I2N1 TaxID=1938796 RepID=UPI0010603AAA|nr:DUF3108 domain-containing protein [Paraburkholderia sp. BL10I2N1]TDN68330.1 uncharacterized protein DUF3108 [Paraburkholderia sp. BL10I2N1]